MMSKLPKQKQKDRRSHTKIMRDAVKSRNLTDFLWGMVALGVKEIPDDPATVKVSPETMVMIIKILQKREEAGLLEEPETKPEESSGTVISLVE